MTLKYIIISKNGTYRVHLKYYSNDEIFGKVENHICYLTKNETLVNNIEKFYNDGAEIPEAVIFELEMTKCGIDYDYTD